MSADNYYLIKKIDGLYCGFDLMSEDPGDDLDKPSVRADKTLNEAIITYHKYSEEPENYTEYGLSIHPNCLTTDVPPTP